MTGEPVSDPTAKQGSESWFAPLLACPDCRAPIPLWREEPSCSNCGFSRPPRELPAGSQPDLRPLFAGALDVRLARHSPIDVGVELERIDTSPPRLAYLGPSAQRDSRELLSAATSSLVSGARVLDHGCGPRDQAVCLDWLGCQYVGFDIAHPNADLLADAHALPFVAESFDCVLSYAVLEHIRSPVVGLREIDRVLAPGGVLVGTVSQGEPFHDSFFHWTTWGLLSLVAEVTHLSVERLWAGPDTLTALAGMGRYPRVIKALLGALSTLHRRLPWLAPRTLRQTAKRRQIEALHRAGSICFLMRKNAS